ncbi:conserved hypothetical protein [Tenacibaculum maritimum]|uniref:hypothetical protein n=1 Tax=Tenacibaculum maritimum TaxID=107401 RepID=UPI0012E604E5|nr:hypothetical protein [Tenacibaculum maritimum]CAA0143769.1 conserved hypothetical protein [Tenacibaculum maritimum]CAA0144412.1 conserved hypothetical protein [Tenacibaculum maritimum]CAA0205706.1 conserved hypothetical protein [Tenacibaculum maritimum]CAA0248282.1 conserved hypothetical protein [Tenacibaculum maritimum]
MVTIINYKERQKEDGTTFYVLEVQGGIEMIRSKSTGNFYATAKKAYVPSTFDEAICKGLIGTQMDGSIKKQDCKPYEYTIKDTGEVIELTHTYVFLPPEEVEHIPQETFKTENIFSKNGILEPTM